MLFQKGSILSRNVLFTVQGNMVGIIHKSLYLVSIFTDILPKHTLDILTNILVSMN